MGFICRILVSLIVLCWHRVSCIPCQESCLSHTLSMYSTDVSRLAAAEMLERGPPLWSALYPSAGSSLQHAHQLQLLSHQQLVRQQELYMIQQQAAQVMELQRNAQFVVSEAPCVLIIVGV